MPAIFSRSLDGHARQAAVGAVVAVGLFVVGWYYYTLPSYTRVGYTPEATGADRRKELHAGKLGMDCIPATKPCSNRPLRACPRRARA